MSSAAVFDGRVLQQNEASKWALITHSFLKKIAWHSEFATNGFSEARSRTHLLNSGQRTHPERLLRFAMHNHDQNQMR